MVRALFLAALSGLSLCACTPTQAPEAAPTTPAGQSLVRDMSGPDKAACQASGGRVERRGRLGSELCVRPFADAGKSCTDSAQCQGKCVATGNTAEPQTAGQCQADDRLFGCYSEIKGGKSAYTICVD